MAGNTGNVHQRAGREYIGHFGYTLVLFVKCKVTYTEYLNQDIPMTPTMTPPKTAPRPSSTNSVVV